MALRPAIDAVKRIMAKEELHRQMTGQASATPFMTVRHDHYHYK